MKIDSNDGKDGGDHTPVDSSKRKGNRRPPSANNRLSGTTLRVYRLMYKRGHVMSVNEVQRLAGLSSPSVAYYYLAKLKDLGLVREAADGYLVDRILFENMIRIRRSLIPLQTTFAIFFATTLVALLIILRPPQITSLYAFALAINAVALGIFIVETVETFRNSST